MNDLPATLAWYLDEVYAMDDAKSAFVKEHKSRELAGNFEEFGTKASGFSEDGPFSCKNCVHKKPVQGAQVCVHPKVNGDEALKDKKKADGFVVVDADYCCRYVRPPAN